MLIYHQEEKYKELLEIGEFYNGVKHREKSLRKVLLMINLKEKLGMKLLEEDDFIHKDTLNRDFRLKEIHEGELKESIEWLQERIKDYKKKFK